MLQPHSPSPSLSDLPIMAVHPDSSGHDPTMSPSISGDQDLSFSPDSFDFSFHDPSCKTPLEACIADEIFVAGKLLPSNAQKPKTPMPPREVTMDSPRKARPRWYRLAFGLVRAPLPEMEVRDIKKRVKRKLANPGLEMRKSSAGWRLLQSLSCRAVESVAVVPMSIVYRNQGAF